MTDSHDSTGSKFKTTKSLTDARLDELSKVMSGVNWAAGILTPGAGARTLTIQDLLFYLHNRRRELNGQTEHTPDEWFEANR